MKSARFFLTAFLTCALSQLALASNDYNTEQCLFGQHSGDWAQIKSSRSEFVFQAGDKISLHVSGREKGLLPIEKRMIQLAVDRTFRSASSSSSTISVKFKS